MFRVLELITYASQGEFEYNERIYWVYRHWATTGDNATFGRTSMELLQEKGITIVDEATNSIEIFTNDPSTLSDHYLQGVLARIRAGQARQTDWAYAEAAIARQRLVLARNQRYDFGKLGSPFMNHEARIRKDLGIPDNWLATETDNTVGVRFMDPKNRQNHIRVMPGRKQSQYANSQKPYVVRYINGAGVDRDGKKIPQRSGADHNKKEELHVPYDDFSY